MRAPKPAKGPLLTEFGWFVAGCSMVAIGIAAGWIAAQLW